MPVRRPEKGTVYHFHYSGAVPWTDPTDDLIVMPLSAVELDALIAGFAKQRDALAPGQVADVAFPGRLAPAPSRA